MSNVLSGALSGMNFTGMWVQVLFWVGYGLIGLLVLGVLVAIYYLLSFNVKANTWNLYGSGKDGVFSVSKQKWNRLKWINKKTAWRPLFPLFNKMELEPFDSEYVYPGKQVYAFVLNDKWMPGRINIDNTEETIRCEVNPVPYYVRNWQSLQHKKNAKEFAEHNFWEDNKYFFMVIVTAVLCLVMVGVTVYFTYKFATGGNAAMSNLANALRGFNTIPSI